MKANVNEQAGGETFVVFPSSRHISTVNRGAPVRKKVTDKIVSASMGTKVLMRTKAHKAV